MDALTIKNLALFELGWTKSETAGSTTITKVDIVYDQNLATVLEEYDWNFQSQSSKLTTPTTLTYEQYKYEYELPSDYKRLINVYSDTERKSPILEYEVYYDTDKWYISCANSVSINVVYISSTLTDFYDYVPSYFVNYFKFFLAYNLCSNLTGDDNLQAQLEKKMLQQKILAYRIDSRNVKVKFIRAANKYINLRRN